jgi:branched-chain amino acid transport system ATP-binding protein
VSIQVRDLHAGYVPDVSILNGVSLTVEDSSIVTIVGPNGSGKSTLLKTIMGYLPPSAGDVSVDGVSMRKVPVHERAIAHGLAYVPQLANVFGPLTVRENLELGGARLPRADRRRRIAELLELYPRLAERQRQRADSQSGGERQMLAIARALMTRPRCLLLDEPSAGLSPLMIEQLFEMLAELRARDGVTILLVEQNAVQSLAISDRGLVLVLGAVALEDRAQTLLDDRRVSALYLGGADGELDDAKEGEA